MEKQIYNNSLRGAPEEIIEKYKSLGIHSTDDFLFALQDELMTEPEDVAKLTEFLFNTDDESLIRQFLEFYPAFSSSKKTVPQTEAHYLLRLVLPETKAPAWLENEAWWKIEAKLRDEMSTSPALDASWRIHFRHSDSMATKLCNYVSSKNELAELSEIKVVERCLRLLHDIVIPRGREFMPLHLLVKILPRLNDENLALAVATRAFEDGSGNYSHYPEFPNWQNGQDYREHIIFLYWLMGLAYQKGKLTPRIERFINFSIKYKVDYSR